MAPPQDTCAEARTAPGDQLERLLGMYAEQKRLYGRVLELSTQQTDLLRRGTTMDRIRRVLEAKRDCLQHVAQVEGRARRARRDWEADRPRYSGGAQARLHRSLREVADVIEEILLREEENDRIIMDQARHG